MRIGLHDSDATGFPNLALMKLSAWHKSEGDEVEWWNPLLFYDKVYSSKVFTFTPENPYLPENTVRGGTGYGVLDELPQEVDNMQPDYSLYPDCDHAIGFLTRGCIRKCPWCIVPKKEGLIRQYRTWQEIKRQDSKDIVLRKIGANPFAQPYRDFTNNIEPTQEQRDLARWVNHKAIFKTVSTFAEYKGRKI